MCFNKKNVQKMLSDIDKKIMNWNERSCFTIKGIKNLSRSDLDSIKLYAQAILAYGSYNCYMKPRGEVLKVLQAYNLAEIEEGCGF